MAEKSLSMQIIEAIEKEDSRTILKLFKENPEQRSVHTFMGGQSWLGYASQIGKLEAVKMLVKLGVDVNLGDKNYGSRPICSAADNGHYDLVEFLINNGTKLDVSESVRNALFAAIVGRDPRIVKLLLEAGIDSKVVYNSKTMKNMDAIAFSLLNGELECAQIIALWNAGGDEQEAKLLLDKADKVAGN